MCVCVTDLGAMSAKAGDEEECAVLLLDTDFPEHTRQPGPARTKQKARKKTQNTHHNGTQRNVEAYEMVINTEIVK